MSPVPEKESKLPVSALCSAADEGNPPWGRFVHSDLLDGMQSELLLYKVGKYYRPFNDEESPPLDKPAWEKLGFGSTDFGNEKIFDPLALVSQLTTKFYGLKKIGEGNFGVVYKGFGIECGKEFAIKVIKAKVSDAMERVEALDEVKLWETLGSHENIVGLIEHWFEFDRLHIQMEWCGSCLSEKIQVSLDPLEALEMLYQVSKGLHFIHGHGIAHLDVKPDNMYHSNGVYKLGDFGCAEFTSNEEAVEGGDGRYMPAEILKGDRCEHLDKVDIFSLGISTYELTSGKKLPREGDEFDSLREGNLDLSLKFPDDLGRLIKSMMHPDPVQRPSAKDILNHPIFDKLNC